MKQRHFPAFSLALLGLLAASYIIYYKGLHGGFLFDDYANLPTLGSEGPIDNWPALWRYLTSGTADPTGRPLTLLTFLIDAHTWPADPFPFKRTNLLLHLLNGALLACLLKRLGYLMAGDADTRRFDLAALLGAAFWLIHPLFVSTTLYIVQREAILPATFTLLGLLSWLHGRSVLQDGRPFRGIAWILAGLGGCTLMGTLSKANGALLPALALTIEYTMLRASPSGDAVFSKQRNAYRYAMLAFAWLPTLAITGYLLERGWYGFTHDISTFRSWTIGQRLLTEPRVLVTYLKLLWIPRSFTPGLFNDNIKVSNSLWSPITTLPAILAVAGLITGACKYRQHWPATSAAILFYFVGQSMESSTISLELYFEHRNYLPAMLIFWPLALWLCGAQIHTFPLVSRHDTPEPSPFTHSTSQGNVGLVTETLKKPSSLRAKLLLAALLTTGLSVMTIARTQLWGNTQDQALLWATLNPTSPRAQAYAAIRESSSGRPERAATRLRRLLAKDPDQVQLALNLFSAECQIGNVDQGTLTAARTALRTTRDTGNLLVHWFDGLMQQTEHPACPQLTIPTIASLLNAAQANRYLATTPGRQQDIYYLQGRLALIQRLPEAALTDFNRALDVQVRESAALEQAALLGSKGFPRQGLAHLDHYEAVRDQTAVPSFGMPLVHDWVLRHQQYWPKELARLRATLLSDATQQQPNRR